MNATKYVIFGWNINKNMLVDGEEISATWVKDTPMDTSANCFFWTKGARIVTKHPEGFNDDFFTQQRGKFSNKVAFDGHTYKKGNYIFKAVGDTEFWCLDYSLNNNSAPNFEFVVLDAGQTYATSVGQLILIASGQTNLGLASTPLEIVSENTVITATTDSCLIIFSKVK